MSSSASSSGSDSDASSSSAASQLGKRKRVSRNVSEKKGTQRDPNDNSDTESDSESGSDTESEEAPVLSHAEKRKQKKKEERLAKLAEDPDAAKANKKGKDKVKNTAELHPSKIPKRQNSVWVGNLSFKTTPESLRHFFEGVGEITRIHMPTKLAAGGPEGRGPRKVNRGFAYVDFATPDAKTVAITMSENPLDGRRLLIKDGDDFKGRPTPAAATGEDGAESSAPSKLTGRTKTAQKILSVQKQPPGPTLFLGNLGFETTEESIRELLESHRPKESSESAETDKWIRKIRMGTFEDSGKCKGWAFVDFTSTEHATTALTNPRNHQLNGRKLVVEYASPEAVRRGGGGGPPRDREHKNAKGPGAGAPKTGSKRDRPSRTHTHAHADGGDGEGVEDGQSPAKKRRAAEAAGNDGDGEETGYRAPRSGRGVDRKLKGDSAGRAGKPERRRAKPGAALALAKREDVAIVPSEGKKIVF